MNTSHNTQQRASQLQEVVGNDHSILKSRRNFDNCIIQTAPRVRVTTYLPGSIPSTSFPYLKHNPDEDCEALAMIPSFSEAKPQMHESR